MLLVKIGLGCLFIALFIFIYESITKPIKNDKERQLYEQGVKSGDDIGFNSFALFFIVAIVLVWHGAFIEIYKDFLQEYF